MSVTKVKLCGMWRDADIEVVNRIRPDYVGFVVDFPKSIRSVTQARLRELSALVEPGITRVGVFVDEPTEVVAELFEAGAIDVAQLHGHEDEAYLDRLRAAADVPVIKAFQVKGPSTIALARESTADVVLMDAGQGTGRAFDWSLLSGLTRDFILAGGLGPDNVREAIEAVGPWGVDMSSGIETEGVKDPEKMRAAVAAVREI